VIIVGDFVDRVVLVGRGAGANPTASAVVADLVDIAAGRHAPTFGVAVADLDPIEPAPLSARVGAYYVRLMVRDEVGVLASVAGALAAGGVSIAQFFQDRHDPGEKVPVVLTTHATDEASMRRALDLITGLGPVMEPPRLIRIEPF
jgi:homoserine dehydrogenase